MANRFPLIIDTDDGNKIKELQTADNLDFTGSGISNLSALTVSGALTGSSVVSTGTVESTGNNTVGGNLSVAGSSTLSGTVSSGALTSTGATINGALVVNAAATITGSLTVSGSSSLQAVTATSLLINGAPVGQQVQSNWAEDDNDEVSFIQNKPTIPASMFDLTDIEAEPGGETNGYVLTWDTSEEYAQFRAPTGGGGDGGIELSDLSVNQQPANGLGTLVYDDSSGVFTYTPPVIPTRTEQLTNDSGFITLLSLSIGSEGTPAGDGAIDYDDTTGEFQFIPPVIPANVSDLVNDSNFATLTDVDTAGYLLTGDVLTSGNVTRTVADGQVTIGIDDSSYLTAEADTLATVTGRGASTTTSIEADRFVQSPTSTTTCSFVDADIETLDIITSITSTSGNFSTGGNITASTGTITGNTVTGTTTNGGNISLLSNTIQNSTSTITLDATGAVIINDGVLRLTSQSSLPASPTAGDIIIYDNAVYVRVADDGSGSAGNILLGGFFGGIGFQLPSFEDDSLPTGIEGQIIYNATDSQVQVYNGSNWVAV